MYSRAIDEKFYYQGANHINLLSEAVGVLMIISSPFSRIYVRVFAGIKWITAVNQLSQSRSPAVRS